MSRFTVFAPIAAVMAIAASPAAADPTVSVRVGPELQDKVEELGARDVADQADRLAQVVQRVLVERGALDGATIDLVLTDLKPNKPTFQQVVDQPGLDMHRSISIGGATIEGQVTLADGRVEPIQYDWYSNSVADVRGFTTWHDARRAYERLADNLAEGRFSRR